MVSARTVIQSRVYRHQSQLLNELDIRTKCRTVIRAPSGWEYAYQSPGQPDQPGQYVIPRRYDEDSQRPNHVQVVFLATGSSELVGTIT